MADKEKDNKYKYKVEIQQMMFVSGESNDPPVDVTSMVEDIVRSQVVEILLQGTALAMKRGARSIVSEDLIFLIRHDRAKVNRLRTYLSWKEVRKNARDNDGGAVDGADLLEDTNLMNNEAKKVYKKAKIRLPWELQFMFSEQPLEENEDDNEDEDEVEASSETMQRLKNADDRTKNMTKEEYVHWSECRQASFTFRKGKRFREWAGINHLTESKPSDDIIDILGFLTFEIVANLTEQALKIKEREEELQSRGNTNSKKRKRERYLFDGPEEGQKPIQVRHIQEAYRHYQKIAPRSRSLRSYSSGGLVTAKVQII